MVALESELVVVRDRLAQCEAELSAGDETTEMIEELRQELHKKTRQQANLDQVIRQLKEEVRSFRQQPQPVSPSNVIRLYPREPINDAIQATEPNIAELRKTISHIRGALKKSEAHKEEMEEQIRLV